MIYISQNCLAGHLYHLKNIPFNHPFIWCVIDFNSMKTMITEWYKINFNNYVLEKETNYNIIIDNKIKIQYVHYKFDSMCNIPIKKDPGDIFYNKIENYIVQKYEDRIKRMANDKPLFCIANFKTIYNDAFYTYEQIKELEQFNNVKILRGFEDKTPIETSIEFFNRYII